jgi:hypothetical protein
MTEQSEPAPLCTPGACRECDAIHIANAIALHNAHRRCERTPTKADFSPFKVLKW